jgi:hypothetical protein
MASSSHLLIVVGSLMEDIPKPLSSCKSRRPQYALQITTDFLRQWTVAQPYCHDPDGVQASKNYH